MDPRSDFLNNPSHHVSQYAGNSILVAGNTPAEAAASIISHFKKKLHWPKEEIKKLAEFMISECGGGTLESTREVVVSHFAARLDMDPTTFLKSKEVHRSFVKTLGSEFEYSDLSIKLSRDQALWIAKSIMGKTQASNLEYDTLSRRGSVDDFSYQVITRICQMKGRYYSIKNFLDELKNPDVST